MAFLGWNKALTKISPEKSLLWRTFQILQHVQTPPLTLPSRTRRESFSAPHHDLEVHTAATIPRASSSGAPLFTMAHTQTLVKHPCCYLVIPSSLWLLKPLLQVSRL